MERLLFNQPKKKISLIECMYILNENNYKKSLYQFRDGLNELKKEDLKMDSDCVFYELNKILNQNNFNYFSKTTNIKCDENSDSSNFLGDSCVDGVKDENGVLGFLREPL